MDKTDIATLSIENSEEQKRLNKIVAVTHKLLVKQECEDGINGLLRVSDLVEFCKDPQWDHWYGNTRKYWEDKTIIHNGKITDESRDAILSLNL